MLTGCECQAVSQNAYKAVSSEMHDDGHYAMCHHHHQILLWRPSTGAQERLTIQITIKRSI